MKCDYCGHQAQILLPHLNLRLCSNCYRINIIKRVSDELKRFNLVDTRDIILMGVSGGKDSFVLLDVLSKIHDPEKLVALTIIEGIPNYNRSDEIEFIRRISRERGVDHIVTSFKEKVGFSLFEMVDLARVKTLELSACTFCGIIRRRLINEYAREIGATKTATAHNLDDEAQTLLINFFRGDTSKLLRQHPIAPVPSPKLIKRIKPLRKIYEWEAATYAYYYGYRFQEVECPYILHQPTVRARIRRWMIMLEKERPGILLSLLNNFDDIIYYSNLARGESKVILNECKLCGEPTSPNREYCKICELLTKIGVLKDRK